MKCDLGVSDDLVPVQFLRHECRCRTEMRLILKDEPICGERLATQIIPRVVVKRPSYAARMCCKRRTTHEQLKSPSVAHRCADSTRLVEPFHRASILVGRCRQSPDPAQNGLISRLHTDP